jgi:hypothetical protein
VIVGATMRDLAIIMVALLSIFFFVLMGILVWQIWRLTKVIDTEIRPVLQDAQETMATMRATSIFMNENVVRPVTKATGQAVAARRTVQVLMDGLMPKRKS